MYGQGIFCVIPKFVNPIHGKDIILYIFEIFKRSWILRALTCLWSSPHWTLDLSCSYKSCWMVHGVLCDPVLATWGVKTCKPFNKVCSPKLPLVTMFLNSNCPFWPIFSLLSLGLSSPINFHFKIASSGPPFPSMAFDWLAAVLPANQKPWWKIAGSLTFQQGNCYLCQSFGSLLLTDKPALGLGHGLVITCIWNVWYVPKTPVYLNPLFQVGHGMDE